MSSGSSPLVCNVASEFAMLCPSRDREGAISQTPLPHGRGSANQKHRRPVEGMVMAESGEVPSAREQRLAEAVAGYYTALEAGRPPDRTEFVARYPDLQEELEAFLNDKAAFERRFGPGGAGAPSPSEAPTLPPADSPTLDGERADIV